MVRLVSGVLLAAAFFALIWFANSTTLLFVALVVGALALHEYVQLLRSAGVNIPAVPTLLASWGATIAVPFSLWPLDAALAVSCGGVLIAIWVMTSGRAADDFALGVRTIAAATLGVVYTGLPLGALVAVHVYGGRNAVLLLLSTIVVSDTAQFYSGRLFGRHPLAPHLSPKKTIEGAVGGFVIAPIFLVVAASYVLPGAENQFALAALGLVLVAAGIAGDLFESMLKRAANVKDSAALIPGHGGVLDRIDALLFASPVFYVFVAFSFSV
jgi:phosphatidate cytidylyltransferase